MIKLEKVTKKYGDTVAVSDINFEIKQGEIVGILGPNGAGKTTTLRIISGYLPPTEGKVLIQGIDMMENPLEAKRHLGYMPENVPLYLDLEVKEYLVFFAKLLGAPKDKLNSHVDKILEKTHLVEVQKKLIGTLSKGYRQRVGLAQALLGGPDILILDEPTIGLDPIQIIEIRNLIKDLAKEQTVLLSSHILPEVDATCTRILIINNGKIVADGKTEELAKITKGSKMIMVKIRGNENDILNRFDKLTGIEKIFLEEKIKNDLGLYKISSNIPDSEEEIARFIIKEGWGLQELKQEYLDLENIFLQLTKGEEKKEILANNKLNK